MNRQLQRILAMQYLGSEVSRFVSRTLEELAAQGVVDAPGVIGGVLLAMRQSDSAEVRQAVTRTELVLCQLLMPQALRRLRRLGA
jgi:hypothetical protein